MSEARKMPRPKHKAGATGGPPRPPKMITQAFEMPTETGLTNGKCGFLMLGRRTWTLCRSLGPPAWLAR
jgi:hypothetical protein